MASAKKLRPKVDLDSANYTRTVWAGAVGADYDICASDPAKSFASGNTTGRMCRRIHILTSGALVVTGSDGVDVTLPAGLSVIDGQYQLIKAAGSAAFNLIVCW